MGIRTVNHAFKMNLKTPKGFQVPAGHWSGRSLIVRYWAVGIMATEEFLVFSKQAGNDLSTPVPEFGFAGLKAGDQWCLCASRWKEALDAGAGTDGSA